MAVMFSVTIDSDKNGKLSLWYQRKEYLTPAQEMELNDLRARMERILIAKAPAPELGFNLKTDPAGG